MTGKLKVCHISGESPNKHGSPFLLVDQQEIFYDKHYRSGPEFLGHAITDQALLISAKHYFGETADELHQSQTQEARMREACKLAKSGDLEGVMRYCEAGFPSVDPLIRVAALQGQPAVVDYLLFLETENTLEAKALEAFTWACKGGLVSVVAAIEAKTPVKQHLTEDALLQISKQGDRRLFRYFMKSEDIRLDTEYLLEMVRNKWAEDVICDRLGFDTRLPGTLSKRGIKASL